MTDTLPTIQQELDRKALEAADELSRGYAHGKVGGEALAVGYRLIWQVTSGLVSDEVSSLLSQLATDAAKLPKEPLVSIFKDDEGVVKAIVSWYPGSCSIAIHTAGPTIEKGYPMEDMAMRQYRHTCALFGSKYKEVIL